MKSYSNITFLIPIRIDSFIRLENLIIVISNLVKIKGAKIIIMEASAYNNGILNKLYGQRKNIRYIYIKDEDPVFHRTYYINEMLNHVDTDIVSVWDADVLVSNCQIEESLDAILKNGYDVSFPFDGTFLDVDDTSRCVFYKKPTILTLKKLRPYLSAMYGSGKEEAKQHPGGGFLIRKSTYINSGGENENFYGWGPEDTERVIHWRKMDIKIHRSSGCMFHLYHPRDINGGFRSALQEKICTTLIEKAQDTTDDLYKKKISNRHIYHERFSNLDNLS